LGIKDLVGRKKKKWFKGESGMAVGLGAIFTRANWLI
jgi:hypothetical protein